MKRKGNSDKPKAVLTQFYNTETFLCSLMMHNTFLFLGKIGKSHFFIYLAIKNLKTLTYCYTIYEINVYHS